MLNDSVVTEYTISTSVSLVYHSIKTDHYISMACLEYHHGPTKLRRLPHFNTRFARTKLVDVDVRALGVEAHTAPSQSENKLQVLCMLVQIRLLSEYSWYEA